jgi:hypothetical protein
MSKKTKRPPQGLEIEWAIDIDNPDDPGTKAAMLDLARALGRLAARCDLAVAKTERLRAQQIFQSSEASDRMKTSDEK